MTAGHPPDARTPPGRLGPSDSVHTGDGSGPTPALPTRGAPCEPQPSPLTALPGGGAAAASDPPPPTDPFLFTPRRVTSSPSLSAASPFSPSPRAPARGPCAVGHGSATALPSTDRADALAPGPTGTTEHSERT